MKRLFLLSFVFLCFFVIATAQQKTLTGTVKSSADGEPVIGATVVLKGTSTGTTTDVNGSFRINVPPDGAVLVITYIGMKKQEVNVGTRTTVDVLLEPDLLGLEEVVVTAIGISREKKSLGYAVQDIGGDKITRAETGNLLSGITGKLAGVNITSSAGAAGAASFITIRGQNSITGDNQPLFVVDGVPVDNSMDYSGNPDDGRNNLTNGVNYSNRLIDLNPDDVASVSVLKGGAATALYGMRAGNGVIIITTKRGSDTGGRMNVSFSSSVAFDKVNKLPEMQMLYAQGNNGVYSTTTTNSWGPLISDLRFDGATDYPRDRNGMLVLATNPAAKQDMPAIAYDNAGNFFQTGMTVNNNISVTGGNKDANFFLSVGNNSTRGVIPRNKFGKTTIKLSGESHLGKSLVVSATANYIRSGGDRMQHGSNVSGVMVGLMRCTPTFDNSNGHGSDGYKFPDAYMYDDGTPRRYATYDNPYWTVNKNVLTDQVDRIIGNVMVKYNPVKDLTVTYRLGDDFYSDRRSGHTALLSANIPEGQQEEDQHYNNSLNSDFTVNYFKEILSGVTANITVGQNLYQSYKQQLYTQGSSFVIPDFYHMSNTSSQLVRESKTRYRTAALYADLQFSYRNMIFLGFTGRNEWSTTLPENNNSFFFPSASAGFIFSELPFLKNNKFLSYGKLRASYAQIANHATPYNTINTFTLAVITDGWATGDSFPFDGIPGFVPSNVLSNPTLKPESLLSREVGVELKFLNNRMNLDFTYYNNQNKDLLIPVPITGSSGFNSTYINAATMENKGVEIMANAIPVQTGKFSWSATVNFTMNKNKVLSLAEGVTDIGLGGFTGTTINVVVGEAYGSMFSTSFYKDENGNVIINDDPLSAGYGYPIRDETMKSLGGIAPRWTMGINNEFSYDGLSLSFLFDIKNGGIMWNGTLSRMIGFGTSKLTEKRGQPVIMEGVKGHIEDGEIVSSGEKNDIETTWSQYYFQNIGGGSGPAQEQFVDKTDWVRLRELTLSYDLGKVINKSFLRQAKVYFTGRNLWLQTPYRGIDPETNLMGAFNAQGLDYFNMPNTKSYVFGLRFDF
ncbi:MAG: SusC/RagA family TonB-linked outer membrane protein [Bacteroidales bacterium]